MLIHQPRSKRHLSLCGVRCNTGTDEVLYPSLFTAISKSVWAFVALVALIHLFVHPGCTSNQLTIPPVLTASIIGFIVFQALAIINDIVIMAISFTGSLMNYQPRKKIEVFVYIALIIYLLDVVWDAYSTFAIFSPELVEAEQLANCTSYSISVTIYRVVILSHWALVVVSLSILVFIFDPLNCCLLSGQISDLEKALKKWDRDENERIGLHKNPFSIALWCRCCDRSGVASNRKSALSDLAHIFRVIFDGLEIQYTFLDIVAGFRLQLSYHSLLRDDDTDPTNLIKDKTIAILSRDKHYSHPTGPQQLTADELNQCSTELKFYLKYAMAAYGWPIHVYLNPIRGPASLCLSSRCNCCCARCQEPHFDGNTCFPNQAAIKAMTGAGVEDIIDASFVNYVHIVPFFVVKIDNKDRKELIVAIRGTLSLKDALTDASARMEEIEGGILGVQPSFIHRGIYRASKGVYDHLMENETFCDLASKPEYRIILTGHSLGAGVAAVLAVLFKEHHPDWSDDLKAYNFATPPVFSYDLAQKSQSFITAVINGYDIIPRMTIRGLAHVLFSVKDLIDNSKQTKHSVLCCTECRGTDINAEEVQQRQKEALAGLDVKRPGTVDERETTALVETDKEKAKFGKRLLEHLSRLHAARGRTNVEGDGIKSEEDQAMMFTPGRILHLEVEEVNKVKRCFSCGLKKAGRLKASWKRREEFSGIQVHTSMLLDHGPTRTIDYVTTFCDQVEPSVTMETDQMEDVATTP